MKNLIFCLSLLSVLTFRAQTVYETVKVALRDKYPGIELENKIIILNKWSPEDNESRERNIALNKTVSAYEFAKLKGGAKGIIGIALYDGAEPGSSTLLTSDSKLKELQSIYIEEKFLVFDSNGLIIYKSLSAGNIFDSIHKLVTR